MGSTDTVARWFSTDAPASKLSPKIRLLWEHVKLVWNSSLPWTGRIRGVLAYLATRAIRGARVIGGRYKRMLLRQGMTVRSEPEA
jgi:hypothetical protein